MRRFVLEAKTLRDVDDHAAAHFALDNVVRNIQHALERDVRGERGEARVIEIAREAGLPYVYLGYWIEGCRKMVYKSRFRPLEGLGPDGWTVIDPARLDADNQVQALPG